MYRKANLTLPSFGQNVNQASSEYVWTTSLSSPMPGFSFKTYLVLGKQNLTGDTDQAVSEEQLFTHFMVLYVYTAKRQRKIILGDKILIVTEEFWNKLSISYRQKTRYEIM